VVRDGADGPEVLMGIRGSGHRFMPNRLVFPGGAVDPADRTAVAAAEPRPEMLAMMERLPHRRLARAIAMAAARELEEETGLSLGTPPRLDTMHYLCRAITPARSPIRFNARFLVTMAEATTGTPSDSTELHDVRFIPVHEALNLGLMLVTREVLLQLVQWLALSPEQRDARAMTSVFRNEAWGTEGATARAPAPGAEARLRGLRP
jgi:8-oxo-dGTP pyrophosphatase MutT (NUDIX family)